MPPSYEKQKIILKIYIRLLLYIKDKYNEIGNPSALLQHLTNKINLINQDEALDKIFYNLFLSASQTRPKVELQEDSREKMSKLMESMIASMIKTYDDGDLRPHLDKLTFPINLKDLTSLDEVLKERGYSLEEEYNKDNRNKEIIKTRIIIRLLLYRVEEMIKEMTRQADEDNEDNEDADDY